MKKIVITIAVLLLAAFSPATLIEVGNGSNLANVTIEWSDGYVADFAVYFDVESVTGYDVMALINDEVDAVTIVFQNYGTVETPSWFLDGITLGDHSNSGYGGGEDWWHQWVKVSDGGWQWGYGMSTTIMTDGDSQAFIYGRAGAPVPEPLTFALLGAGMLLVRKRK